MNTGTLNQVNQAFLGLAILAGRAGSTQTQNLAADAFNLEINGVPDTT